MPLPVEISPLSQLAMLFTREVLTCSVLGSNVAFQLTSSGQGEGGMEHWQACELIVLVSKITPPGYQF